MPFYWRIEVLAWSGARFYYSCMMNSFQGAQRSPLQSSYPSIPHNLNIFLLNILKTPIFIIMGVITGRGKKAKILSVVQRLAIQVLSYIHQHHATWDLVRDAEWRPHQLNQKLHFNQIAQVICLHVKVYEVLVAKATSV